MFCSRSGQVIDCTASCDQMYIVVCWIKRIMFQRLFATLQIISTVELRFFSKERERDNLHNVSKYNVLNRF